MPTEPRAPAGGGGKHKLAIMEGTILLLEERGADGLLLEDVLAEADASAGSLYHHFGSRDGLLVAAEEERYRTQFRNEDPANLDDGFSAKTTEEFFAYLTAQIRRIVTDPANVPVRRNRLKIAAR